MNGINLALFLSLGTLGLAACAGSGATAPQADATHAEHDGHLRAQPWERDPCTRTSEILIDGAVVGYLVEYQAIPVGMVVERSLPTGSYRIEGPRFEEIGFVTPRGDVRRYAPGGSESLGVWQIDEGLRRFFASSSRVRLHELQPAAPPKAVAPEKGGEKDDAKKDGAKKDGEGDGDGGKKQDAPGGN